MVHPPLYPIGPRLIQLCKIWARPVALYGATGAIGVAYFTDWKAVLQYVPFYNGKYKEE
ncbi:cytochrome b-c1 complex subunit 10-like [Rhipicephalus microplus]|uniref:cytochrome b-c1 complex subunit 10-like n=1 Tax=Rhipicephalus microplus TaxID=6941 RepID=UPI003F6D6CAD